MTIKFCKNCNNMQIIITKNSKQYLICKTCNTIEPIKTEERIIEPQKFIQKEIGSGVAKRDFSGHHFKYQECGNDKCKVIDLGMMIGDEDWVYLLQCTKCDYAERVGNWC